MVMDEKMDEGDIIDIKKISISPMETSKTLFEKFADLSGLFATETIIKLDKSELVPGKQNKKEITYCKKITKEEGLLDFHKPAQELYHLFQGLTPWPGIFTEYQGKKLIIENCSYTDRVDSIGDIGTVVATEREI